MHLSDLLKASFFGNGGWAWLTALGIVVLGVPLLFAMRRVLVVRLTKLSQQTSVAIADVVVAVLERTHGLFLLLLALFGGSLALTLPADWEDKIRTALSVGVILQLGRWGSQAIRSGTARYEQAQEHAKGTVTAMAFMARLALWALISLLMLDNFGVEVTALITTLGVGGIAVALAAQSVLGDLLATISIFLDKPFVVGDFIILDEYLGTISSIGLRSTRINSLSGEQVIISNSDLLKGRIRNYREMKERRVVFQIGVRYGTRVDAVALVPKILREAVEAEERTRFDRGHLKGFGESSLDFEVVYYVLSGSYNDYMDAQQAINLTILRRFEEERIAFAHPVRMTTMEQADPRDVAPVHRIGLEPPPARTAS